MLDDRQRDVFADGERLQQRAALKEHAEAAAHRAPAARSSIAVISSPKSLIEPLVGFIEPMTWRSSVDFPQPDAAHDDHRVAFHDLEGNAIEHAAPVELADEIGHFDDGRSRASRRRMSTATRCQAESAGTLCGAAAEAGEVEQAGREHREGGRRPGIQRKIVLVIASPSRHVSRRAPRNQSRTR